jgi:DNA repair protein RecN (Recombination protein N)
MLVHLHVKNFALIEEINVDFNNNLNILTGETGAGKSIIIGSINAVLGQKINKDMIRTGCDSALIELLFYVENNDIVQRLHDYDINIDNNRELLITRKIANNGRSVFRINRQVVTTAIVKDISSKLIDIHGQHEHQSLLLKKNYIELLDSFCVEDIIEIKNNIKNKYNQYIKLWSKIDDSISDEQKRKKEISFIEYELNEIESSNLKIGEDITLQNDYKKLSNGKKIAQSISEAHSLINGTIHNSTIDNVAHCVRILRDISKIDENINDLTEQISNVEIILSDFNRELNDYINSFELDEKHYDEVESRIDLINNLKMKYGNTIEEILDYQKEKEIRLQELINYEQYIHNINIEISKLTKEIKNDCDILSSIRKNKAKEISEKIVYALKDINLINADFIIKVTKKEKFDITGWDDIDFLLTTNIGEPPKSLSKVASGGELSRIMLAIKSVLASSDDIDTLIFDEIDTGISGKTASMVAKKLAHISKEHQVVCITHLPQIAAMADTHFVIEKKVENTYTNTLITSLDNKSSIEEIGRLLGGLEITDAVLTNAKEMKTIAKKIKKEI